MSNFFFRFKQFTVYQDRCAMKVGTDGVLLGAWTPVDRVRRILDVGTGTGLVALMLAQRTGADVPIDAVEVDLAAAEQARDNFQRSPWNARLSVIAGDFNTFYRDYRYDLIVSNPPYFADGLQCSDKQRDLARHNHLLTYENLFKQTSSLLTEEGAFTLIIPAEVSDSVEEMAALNDLYPVRQLLVVTKQGKKPKRTLITFTRQLQHCEQETMFMEDNFHHYSTEYEALIKDYYLK